MKRSCYFLIFAIPVLILSIAGCKEKTKNPVIYKTGAFPDTVVNLQTINSQYDDYNTDIYQLTGEGSIIFSSNRKTSGGKFDLEQASISFLFDQTNGYFEMATSITNDAYLTELIKSAVTPGDDFGPYRFYSSVDGFDYLVLASENAQGNLDFFYLKNRPPRKPSIPAIEGPLAISQFNTSSDDAYFCLDNEQDTAYFSSNRNGNFDIFLQGRQAETPMSTWFNQGFRNSVAVDSINSASEDKCPQIMKKIMVFASNRPGGMGGYDLYYSVLRKGKWSTPVNLGPKINSSSDEYRPLVGFHPDFDNEFIVFSSNRPGGKGGFDLYFSGIQFPDK